MDRDRISTFDLNLARNERAITSAREIACLSPAERAERLAALTEKIQAKMASLYEENVLRVLLEEQNAERLLDLHARLPDIDRAIAQQKRSHPHPETPLVPAGTPKTARLKAPDAYPTELLDFLASQKPPPAPVSRATAKHGRSAKISAGQEKQRFWTLRDSMVTLAVVIVLIGVAWFQNNSRTRSADLLTFDQQTSPDNPQTRAARVEQQQRQAQFDAALQTLRTGNFEQGKTELLAFIRSYSSVPEAEEAYIALADTYRQRQQNPDEALIYYQTMLNEYPQSPRAGLVHLKMGFAYEDLDDLTNAEQMYRLVIQREGEQSRVGQLANERLQQLKARPK